MKRILDFLVSACSLVMLSPLLVLIALVIRWDSRGEILFRQVRVGRGCRTFRMLKFRSMVLGAPLLGPSHTEDQDKRVTRVGRYLRRSSLDELPQLFNVLKGEMSLVGPRPDLPEQRRLYDDAEWRLRHSVRPGISGLAQATLRSEANFRRRKSLDLYYARHQSLWLDLRILGATVLQVIRKGGN